MFDGLLWEQQYDKKLSQRLGSVLRSVQKNRNYRIVMPSLQLSTSFKETVLKINFH